MSFCLRWDSSGHEEPSSVGWKGKGRVWNSSLVIDSPFHGVTKSYDCYHLAHPGSRWQTWQFLILIPKNSSTQRAFSPLCYCFVPSGNKANFWSSPYRWERTLREQDQVTYQICDKIKPASQAGAHNFQIRPVTSKCDHSPLKIVQRTTQS